MTRLIYPEGFREAPRQGFFRLGRSVIMRGIEHAWDMGIPGLSDVIGDEFLGTGEFYNTSGTVIQFCSALALSAHPEVCQLRETEPSTEIDEVAARVAKLRDARVLDGMRILDLGCGKPNFALAATALGATVFTADLEDLSGAYGGQANRHVVVNLCDPGTSEAIRAAVGTAPDMVTESIVDLLPHQSVGLTRPKLDDILEIGRELLPIGGNLTMTSYHRLSSWRYERI